MTVLLVGCSHPPAAAPPRSTTPSHPTTSSSLPQPGAETSTSLGPAWPTRTIVSSGDDEDLAPTSQALYWLNTSTTSSPDTGVPGLYELKTARQVEGAQVSGQISQEALTVTGGWVWLAFAQATTVVVEQLDPDGLARHAVHHLIETGSGQVQYPPAPVVTATAGGPLWVGAGSDLWALNPVTGEVEVHTSTTGQAAWMSTDPAGAFLYVVSSMSNSGGELVTQLDAHSGRLLHSSNQQFATGAGTAAATAGGVWLSYRTGMAGAAIELSSADLSDVLPPQNGFGALYQMMGVASGVSEGVLWLSSEPSLTCADPTSGQARASEAVANEIINDMVAADHVLYASSP
ncbi:MAG: YncE family protein [Acidimicrobiales bacterium]